MKNGKLTESFDLMASFKDRLNQGEVDLHHHHAEFEPLVDPDDDEAAHDHTHHHHHDHTNSRGNSDSEKHEHSHGVYRHIAHPNGPRTMIDEGVCCCFMSQFPDYVIEEQRRRTDKEVEKK